MPRLSREIIYWNHFQIRYLTLEEGWKNKGFVTTCHKCDYRLPPALDNKWFSREVVYNMVAFISMFSSLLALYLSFLIQAFVIYCSKANDLFSAWNWTCRETAPMGTWFFLTPQLIWLESWTNILELFDDFSLLCFLFLEILLYNWWTS